jgi:hypothetical protein
MTNLTGRHELDQNFDDTSFWQEAEFLGVETYNFTEETRVVGTA